jgi:hypothetical protein
MMTTQWPSGFVLRTPQTEIERSIGEATFDSGNGVLDAVARPRFFVADSSE